MLGAKLLRGDLVYLAPLQREDIPLYVKWFQDLELQYLLFAQAVFPLTEKDETEWYERTITDHHAIQFSIRTVQDDTVIGTGGFHYIENRMHFSEVGLSIGDRNYWGRGYGTEAMRLLLGYGFYELNLHRIELRVYSYNQRAIRSYEKIGFQHEVTERQSLYRDGQYHDVLVMGLLRSEWQDVRE